MGETSIHKIHKDYLELGVSLITQKNTDKSLLQELLTTLSQEYVDAIFALVEKKKITEEEAQRRHLLSSQELKEKLFSDLAKKTHKDVKIKSAKQLIDILFVQEEPTPGSSQEETQPEPIQEQSNTKNKEEKIIPEPNIQGSVLGMGEIILPPDILQVITGSGKGWEKKNTPAGFDKVGLVEAWLAHKLQRERASFTWKKGILADNQMRKVSYYHLYLPELNKTLLLNNQYGEGAFLIEGDFDLREAKKSDLKSWKEVVAINFDYQHPEKFLDILNMYIEKNLGEEPSKKNDSDKKPLKIDTTIGKEEIREYLKSHKAEWFATDSQTRRWYTARIEGRILTYTDICRILGYTEKPVDLYEDTIFKKVSKDIFGEGYEEVIKRLLEWKKIRIQKKIKEYLIEDKLIRLNLETTTRSPYSIKIGEELLTYTDICRIFGFTEERGALRKDSLFKEVSKRIFGEGYMKIIERAQAIRSIREQDKIRSHLEKYETERFSLTARERISFFMMEVNEKISYIDVCRIFGYTEEKEVILRDNIFSQLSKSIFSKTYEEWREEKIKEYMLHHKLTWISLTTETRDTYNITIGKKKFGYVQICRMLGYQEDVKDLLKDKIFNRVTESLFGNQYMKVIERAQTIEKIREKNKIRAYLQKHKTEWFNLRTVIERRKFEIIIDNRKISYVGICRIFGYKEDKKGKKEFSKKNIFDKLTKDIFGEEERSK